MNVVELSGGVGGARMARGFAGLAEVTLTVVVNVGDDADNHGLRISPDVDTVLYTLAGLEGPQGWGRADDTFAFNDELARYGVDNTFRLGDRDLALKIHRTHVMAAGTPLSEVTASIGSSLGIRSRVIPVTDDRVRTRVLTDDGWIGFQEYFVKRSHRDQVLEVDFEGVTASRPAPGVLEAIESADLVVIGPSNPPLSIWPILAVPGMREAVRRHPRAIAVSPLVGGQALKGPAADILTALGFDRGNRGVAQAYDGLIGTLVIDSRDEPEAAHLGVEAKLTDTLIPDLESAMRLATELVET